MKVFLFLIMGTFLAVVSVKAEVAPKLLPFQGRLSDQNGVAISNGVKVVQFKIYSVPTGGSPVWAGEVHRTTVNGGLVNVILGTKTPLAGVDFNQQLYLEITVDVSGPSGVPDNAITAADPPMLPRQVILPVVFAKDSASLAGYDWSSILVSGNNPVAGQIAGSKIQTGGISTQQLGAGSVTASKLAPAAVTGGAIASGTITSSQLAAGAVTAAAIANGTITSNQIALKTITPDRLALRVIGTNVPVGGLALSASCGSFTSPNAGVPATIGGLNVTIATQGHPVEVSFVSDGSTNNNSSIFSVANVTISPTIYLILIRDGVAISTEDSYVRGFQTVTGLDAPPGAFKFLDFPPAGTHTYQVQISSAQSANTVYAYYIRMVAQEL